MTCARCETLREEVARLRAELSLDRDHARIATLQLHCGLSVQQAQLVSLMLARPGRVLSRDTLMMLLGIDTFGHLSALLHHVRDKLGRDVFENVPGSGWRLAAPAAARLRAAVEPPPA